MKKIIPLLLIMIMMLSTGLVWATGDDEDHGQDARSQSMSAESGDEPIEDLSTTRDPGADNTGSDTTSEDSEDSGNYDSADDNSQIAEPVDEDKEGDPSANAPEEEKTGISGILDGFITNIRGIADKVPLKYLAAGGGAIILLLIILIASSKHRRRKNSYHAKH